MAGAHCAAFSFITALTTTTTTTTTTKLLKPHFSCSISISLPPKKLSKRKNHLRPKILKTLTKPLSIDPAIPIIPSTENDTLFEPPLDELVGIVPAVDEVREFQATETEGVAEKYRGVFGEFSAKSLMKVAFGLVGLFMLQTICAVCLLGNRDSDEKNKNLNGLDKSFSGIGKGNFLANENVVYLDRSKFEAKINEIKAMAREVRKTEEKEARNGEEEGGIVDEIVNSKSRIGIEKEIGARLVNLGKKLNSGKGKFEDVEAAKEVDKTLMFKKKFKFRSPSTSIRSDPKGFSGSEDRGAHKKKKNGFASANVDAMESVSRRVVPEKSESEALSTNSVRLQNDAEIKEKMRKEIGVGDTFKRFGPIEETSQGKSSVKFMKSRESRDLEVQNLENFTKERHETTTKSDKDSPLDRNGGLSASIVRDDQSDDKSDFWWLNLPYVLAILMRRGLELEGPGGLFTLRITSNVQDQSEISYTVAFEDRSDANNFCYLLESFFEDLGDFSADIVPLFVKELHQEVKSGTKKMIVVKKGQLKLYAGQPLADVENALHSLVEQK